MKTQTKCILIVTVAALAIIGATAGVLHTKERRKQQRAVEEIALQARRFEDAANSLVKRLENYEPGNLDKLDTIADDYVKAVNELGTGVTPPMRKLHPEGADQIEKALKQIQTLPQKKP
jgi:hypothetical protein